MFVAQMNMNTKQKKLKKYYTKAKKYVTIEDGKFLKGGISHVRT